MKPQNAPRTLTTVMFDLGGVLVWTQWDRVTVPLAEMSGMTPERVMDEIETGEAGCAFMLGKLDRAEFHRRLTEQLGLSLTPDAFFALWTSIIAPNNNINSLLEGLKNRYRLVLASNTDVLHYARSLEVQEALRLFDYALLSYELGLCKPDPEFFRSGLERLAISPEECVFIDDRKENVEAAQTLGIAGTQFVSTQQLELDLGDMGLV